jgi:hypothetical protein
MPEGTLADILQNGALGAAADPPAWPYEQTEFGASMRRRADNIPQIPARLSMANFLRNMFTASADISDYIYGSRPGNRPFVVGMPDLVHNPGQEDYRAAPIGPQHIIAGRLGGVPTRGAPAENRGRLTRENYEAWLKEQEELQGAKAIADGPQPPNAIRAKDWNPGGGLY